MIEPCSNCGDKYCYGDCYADAPVVEDHAPEPSTQTHTTKKKGE